LNIDIRDADLDSPRELARILQDNGLTAKKRFGQNFLINHDVRKRIVETLGILGGELVWEIGPGIGSLTCKLVKKDIQLVVFEIDRGFVRLLKSSFSGVSDITVVEGDFMKTWQGVREASGEPDIIVGNLPYNCASAMFICLIEGGCAAKKIVCTVQREAADRMMARPGSPDYSSFSVLCALTWKMERLGDLNPGSFFPKPRVRSTIMSLSPLRRTHSVSAARLSASVRAIFAGRRKTIRNNLKKALAEHEQNVQKLIEETAKNEFDLDQRPETLPPDRVEELAVILSKYTFPSNNRCAK